MNQIEKHIKPTHRNALIDTVRGFAILVMIAANAWPSLFPPLICPLGLRILFSVAAPLFIFLSGASICYAEEAGKSSSALLKRILQILLMGVFIDTLILKIVPFYTIDVLYLIAFSLLIILIFRRTPDFIQWTIATAFLVGNLFLLDHYQFHLTSSPLSGDAVAYSIATAFQQFVLDGWFPLLPWAGVSFFGYLLCKKRKKLAPFNSVFLVSGSAFIILSLILYTIHSEVIQPLREGYAELFYPVKGIYWLLLSGLIIVLIPALSATHNKTNFLASIGRQSLFMYLLHIIIIALIFPFLKQDAESFQMRIPITVFLGYTAFMITSHYAIQPFIKSLKNGKLRTIGYILGF